MEQSELNTPIRDKEDNQVSSLELERSDQLNKQFVEQLDQLIQDVSPLPENVDNFFDTFTQSFVYILRLSSTVTQFKGPATQLLRNYVDSLHKILDQFSEGLAMQQDPDCVASGDLQQKKTAKKQDLLYRVAQIFANSIQHDLNKSSLTHHSAHLIINFVIRVLTPDNAKVNHQTCPELNIELTKVAASLFYLKNNRHFFSDLKLVFSFVQNCKNFDQKQFVESLMQGSEFLSAKIYLLGLSCLQNGGSGLEHSYLVEQTEKIVFNDKNKEANANQIYFSAFYKSLTEQALKDQIMPIINFAMNRSCLLIQNITFLVQNISFKLSSDVATSLSVSILTKDYLITATDQISKLIQAICDKVDQADEFSKKLLGYLTGEFDKVKLQASTTQSDKLKLLGLACAASNYLKTSPDILAAVSAEFIFGLKEQTEIDRQIQILLSRSQQTKQIVSNLVQKAQFANQIQKLIELQIWEHHAIVYQKLTGTNFEISANLSYILAMMRYVCEAGQSQKLLEHDGTNKYLLSNLSHLNQVQNLKKLTETDVINHLRVLQSLITSNLTKSQHQEVLITFLIEYLVNDDYIFRGAALWNAFDLIRNRWSEHTLQKVLKQVFFRISKDQPDKQVNTSETGETKQSICLAKKISNFLNVVVPKDIKLERDTFLAVVQLIAHPKVSSSTKILKQNYQYLVKTCKIPSEVLFKEHQQVIINTYLRERTGILNSNKTVREVAVNFLILLSWAGLLEHLIPQMMPVFNYKPVEMLDRLEALLQNEFDRISHYDLLFYSEMTKDMLQMYNQQDDKAKQHVLCEKVDSNQSEETKEDSSQNVISASDDMDPALMAMLSKATKGKKGKGKAGPAKQAPKTETVPISKAATAKVEAVSEITKEERNKQDRAQMLKFVQNMRLLKAQQIRCCYQIIRAANQSDRANQQNYQDLTFQYLTLPILKLLNLSATKFDSVYFLQNILNEAHYSPFFQIKGSLVTALIAIADNKLSSKASQEITNCLHQLDHNANFGEMGVGSLQVCLTVANFVLKDPSVNLSVKEVGLNVAQSILMENSQVQLIDLVRLTVNMLKTNYISSTLSGFLRRLIRRTNRVEIALLLQPLFEYQPVPRKVLLNEILLYDEPLFCPVWFSTQMWILLFDEDLGSLSRKIFNKFGLTLRNEVLELQHEINTRNAFHFLRDKNFGIFSLTTKAVSSAMELLRTSPRLNTLIDDLIEFYASEWREIEKESAKAIEADFTKDINIQRNLIADHRTNRIAVPQIFGRASKLLQPQNFEKVLQFLVGQACLDRNDEIKDAAAKAALSLVKSQGPEHANVLLIILESILNQPDKDKQLDATKNQAVILLGHLAQYLGDTAQKKLLNAYENLMDLLPNGSLILQRSICKCIPQLAKFFPDKAKSFFTANLKVLRESKEEKAVRASSFAVAGLLKGLGMNFMVESDLLGTITKESFDSKKTESIRKQAGLYLFESLAFSMGKSFEVFLDKVFPLVLGSISDQKEQVRNAALISLQTIMGMFSNYAIKQALPQFLNELKNDNWRSKFSTVEALGNMAFCAPKQISSYLPQIVKALREVLNDTHEKVHEAAIEAIKKIGSVIKCPEIGDMLEIIVKALSNTNMYLNEALNLMLETSFAHSIDAPSLSLLVPLLDAGLTMHDNTSKQMAAQLMGNICSLTQDPHDLIPYMPILVPAIKQSLFDAIPEIRASAAKALGKLSKGLGTAHCEEMIGWLREHIDQVQTSSSEKSGAAQGFAEMISSHGIEYFEKYIRMVIEKSQDKEIHLREAYRGVLVFLPGCFDRYVEYLPMLVPVMIEGLADDVDEVRKVSMRNVKICIKQFARTSPYQLVLPVMKMMFSPDFRVRESSSILMFQLVKELENDVIRAQPKYIDNDTKQKILASMFILKFDLIEKVNSQAGVIWKSLIDSPLIVLRQIIDTCIQIIFQILQSPSYELQEMGLACIRGIVEKMGEKIVVRAIEIFENLLEKATERTQSVGICKVIFTMAQAAQHRLLQIISPRLVQIMDPYLSAETDELREWSSKVFIVLFQKQPEKAFVEPILDKTILQKLKQLTKEKNENEAQKLIQSLKYLVANAPDLKIEDRMLVLCDITDKTALFTIAQSRIIRALAPTFASKVFTKRFYFSVLSALQEELTAPTIDDAERIQYVLMAYAELISRIPDIEAMQTNDEISKFFDSCQQNKRPGFYLDLIAHYCQNTESNFEKLAEQYLENALKYMNFPDDQLVAKVVAAMNAIMEKIPKENQMLLVQLIKRQIELHGVQIVNTMHSLQKEEGSSIEHLYKKKVPVLMIFKNPVGVQSIVNYVQAAIMHGQVQVRADAAFTFKYILDFSEPTAIKKEIVKICGALIRVVNDKFPQDLKLQIFLALKLIQTRFADAAKAMTPQLQTTFLKAMGDNQTTTHVQQVVLENLILLVKGLPRIDPIIKELASLLDGSKIDGQQKQIVAESLALIIRAKGKTISPPLSEQVAAQLSDLVSRSQEHNDIVLLNSSVALAYLSAFAADPNQMVTLFNAFPGMTPVSIGLKFGVLTNGNETIGKTQMAGTLQVLLEDWLNKCSGFDEINSSTQTDDEVKRFRGAFELLGQLSNTFGRREWCQAPNSPYLALIFAAVNKAQTLKNLQTKQEISPQSFYLLVSVLSQVPIKADKLSPELAEFTRDAFLCIQKFYLEHGEMNQRCTDAILNLLQLNYDNFLDLQNVRSYDRQSVKEATLNKNLEGVIPDDMRMYAVEIVFRKK